MSRIAVLLLLPSSLIVYGAQVSVGPSLATNQAPRHTVTGNVTNAVSGEPIHRALVQINGTVAAAVLTGADGRFQFADVPEGAVVFSIQKPGFSDPRFNVGSQWAAPSLAVTVGSGKNDFHLKLMPNSRIVGHIRDADGEPVENAQVQILFEQIWQGRKQWQPRNNATTDEDGYYRVEDLMPGRYIVFVGGRTVPPPSFNGPREVMAPKYYPDALDLASAQPLELRSGQEFRADFRLRAERGYSLTAQVSGIPAPGLGVGFSLQNSSGQNIWFDGMQFDQAHGQLVVPALPSGIWRLFFNANDDQGHAYQTRQEIAINQADVTDLQLLLRPAASIPVTINHPDSQATETAPPQIVQMVNGSRFMNPRISANLILQDALDMQEYGLQMQGDPPVTEFSGVAPGKYKLDVQALGSECLESAWYGSIDLTHDYVVIDANGGTQPLTINLRADCSTLTAKLGPEERAHSGMVLVVPNSSLGEPKVLTIQGQSNASDFRGFANPSLILSPGSYQIFALTSLEGLEYANPEVLRNYPSQSVNLGPGQKTELTVELTERKEN
jgi:hypothetical protein